MRRYLSSSTRLAQCMSSANAFMNRYLRRGITPSLVGAAPSFPPAGGATAPHGHSEQIDAYRTWACTSVVDVNIDDRKAVVAGVGWSSEAGPDQPFQAQSEYSLAATRSVPILVPVVTVVVAEDNTQDFSNLPMEHWTCLKRSASSPFALSLAVAGETAVIEPSRRTTCGCYRYSTAVGWRSWHHSSGWQCRLGQGRWRLARVVSFRPRIVISAGCLCGRFLYPRVAIPLFGCPPQRAPGAELVGVGADVVVVGSTSGTLDAISVISETEDSHKSPIPTRLFVFSAYMAVLTRNLTTADKKNLHSAVKFTFSIESVTHQLRLTAYPQGSPHCNTVQSHQKGHSFARSVKGSHPSLAF